MTRSEKVTAAMPTAVEMALVFLTMCGVGGVVLRSMTSRSKFEIMLARKRSAMKSAKAHRANIQPLSSVCSILCEVGYKGSDGSQSSATSGSPVGVPVGIRTLDRLDQAYFSSRLEPLWLWIWKVRKSETNHSYPPSNPSSSLRNQTCI